MTTTTPPRLGDLLLETGLINEQDLRRGLEFQQRFGGKLGGVLVRMGAVSEDSLLSQALSVQLSLPVMDSAEIPFEAQPFLEVMERSQIDKDWWLDQELCAWQTTDGHLHFIARDPLDDAIQEVIEQAFAQEHKVWYLTRNQDLDKALDLIAKAGTSSGLFSDSDDVRHLRELAEGAPVVEFVNNLLSQAIDRRASDVHVEPEERTFYVRYRVDGVLHEHLNLPRERFDAIASRIKLISGLDIAERRLPQDGRLNIRVSGQELDIRVSTLPGVHGESIVLRLLPKERQSGRLEAVGMAEDHLALFKNWISEPHGILLVTGPTGSGKSTTLYAALDAVNDRTQKIITVEDPVEYQLSGITQVQAHSEIGYTFAHALRSILRQDPDIVMIGEIRDQETAEIAVQASLTGHLVLSTLHTNDAVSAFTRLIDMGIEPFLVATSLRAVQAQRLVRKLCPHCAQPASPPSDIVETTRQWLPPQLHKTEPTWQQAVGCAQCRHSGYWGRTGIYELVPVDIAMQQSIVERASAHTLRRLAHEAGHRNLRIDGWLKAWQGITSVEEVLRVTESQ